MLINVRRDLGVDMRIAANVCPSRQYHHHFRQECERHERNNRHDAEIAGRFGYPEPSVASAPLHANIYPICLVDYLNRAR